jgi:hypothetical protein
MPSQCIFCSERKLTDEDIWPAWSKRWLGRHPQLGGSTFTTTRLKAPDTVPEILQEGTQPIGGKRAIRCRKCNNKRLGPLQRQASDLLKPMLDLPFKFGPEGSITLTPSDRVHLASWAAMTAMTAEFLPIRCPTMAQRITRRTSARSSEARSGR